jgi:hypothetical protein
VRQPAHRRSQFLDAGTPLAGQQIDHNRELAALAWYSPRPHSRGFLFNPETFAQELTRPPTLTDVMLPTGIRADSMDKALGRLEAA